MNDIKRCKKNYGFSLTELLITLGVTTIILGGAISAAQKGIHASYVATERSEKIGSLKNSLERIAKIVKLTNEEAPFVPPPDHTEACPRDSQTLEWTGECRGNKLLTKIPVVVSGSVFTSDGMTKFGAYDDLGAGYQDCYYVFMVTNPPDPKDRKLIRKTECSETHCGIDNTVCEPDLGETPENCADCVTGIAASCGIDDNGDGQKCDPLTGEDCSNCPQDCGSCCGDGYCNPNHGETCITCPQDCGECENSESEKEEFDYCGNGTCPSDEFENCDNCTADCGDCCGQHGCTDAGETCWTCPSDCDEWGVPGLPCCGDGTCQNGVAGRPNYGETVANCPAGPNGDCALCGDGICNVPATLCENRKYRHPTTGACCATSPSTCCGSLPTSACKLNGTRCFENPGDDCYRDVGDPEIPPGL